ncbi:acyl-CoA dehydrogenase family protein [Streptomyces sp. AK02-04a]|uniref:acyl-CoA dehydrogenase family protein n=1 Tax=Streptomyces sp. AK02-04a TaxID=3028649 RepID=UPI0029B34D2D|nr:acyl-CoA dehydrogenase family protein [Streptomyces sp. AK02-04a]MDX3760028.1 acyl-CoA/acyl-ACP dehydrogenase [Streptomyces sp. AK02-04a]
MIPAAPPAQNPISTSPVHAESPSQVTEILEFARSYASERINSRLIDDRRSLPPTLISDLAAAGLFGLRLEKRYGGRELPCCDFFRVMEQLGAIDPNVMLTVAVHNTVGIEPIRNYAHPDVKDHVLPQLAAGRIATVGSSEPGMGSHLNSMTTQARRTPEGDYVIDGAKCWISLGGAAAYINVFAQLIDASERQVGITGFVVDTTTPGFSVGQEAVTLGMRAVPQHELRLRGVRVGADRILGAEGEGAAQATDTFANTRAVLAACGLGTMKRCLQLAHRFASRRTVATGNLAENGRTQLVLADAVAATLAVEALVHHYADSIDAGTPPPQEVTLALKACGCELLWDVVDRCTQILGARGYLDTNIVGQHFRDFRLFRLFEGATDTVTAYLGWLTLAHPQHLRSWPLVTQSPTAHQALDHLATLAARPRPGTRYRHLLAHFAGEITGWALTTAAAEARASKQPSDITAYTAQWCARNLTDRLRVADHTLHTNSHLPSLAAVTQQITQFRHTIADIGGEAPGENLRIDPLLHE